MTTEREVKIDRNKMGNGMMRLICGFTLRERKKCAELRELWDWNQQAAW